MNSRKLEEISSTFIQKLAREYYGIDALAKELFGESDHNYKLKESSHRNYLLKLSHKGAIPGEVEMQIDLLNYLSKSNFPFEVPSPIPNIKGKYYDQLLGSRILRVQSWVGGRMLSEANPMSTNLLRQWGRMVGLLSKHLQGFDHPYAHRFYDWDPANTMEARGKRGFIKDAQQLEYAEYFWKLFEENAAPYLPDLRKSINYNDAHSQNILIDLNDKAPTITGLIDFGDAVYTNTINELAIACAYAGMNMANPLEAMLYVIEAYHKEFPIMEEELSVLYYLIIGRLLISVSHAEVNQSKNPNNEYLQISAEPAWTLLFFMRDLSSSFAHYRFRAACAFEPCPRFNNFQVWVAQNKSSFCKPINFKNLRSKDIDLSVASSDLGNNSNFEDIDDFHATINQLIGDQRKSIGIGGYKEIRPFYTSKEYVRLGNHGKEWRTVHLGIDVWTKSGTPVYAPIDGEVYATHYNVGDLNYGHTLILKHEINENLCFFTLFGHLNGDSKSKYKKGSKVFKGTQIDFVGNRRENGGWPPHLHFQIMLDMMDYESDFPGVAVPSESKTWTSICPNPNIFFDRNENRKDSSNSDIILKRQHFLGKALSLSYEEPLQIVRGFKQYLYDELGQRYLDTINNVAHVGHQHPRVVEAAKRQISLLNTNTRYLHKNIVEYAELLLSYFPEELSVVYFVNSGSEANELALRMAGISSNSRNMAVLENGYHGNTGVCVDISSYKFDRKGGEGAPQNTHVLPVPDMYRGIHAGSDSPAEDFSNYIRAILESLKTKGEKLGGFIAESIMSCAGQIELPEGYLQIIYNEVRVQGGVCIADEIQHGFGRVGEKFWGFQLQAVVPDIVTLGKSIGNGHPLAALVCTKKIARDFENGMEYFNTFGGNPVSCAIGQEVLKIVEEEKLQSHALMVGTHMLKGLNEIQQQYPIIGDVRGRGLFIGVELVKDLVSKEPASDEAYYLVNRMKEEGFLMSADGPYENVIKIKPPMCFTQENANEFLDNLNKVFSENFLQV